MSYGRHRAAGFRTARCPHPIYASPDEVAITTPVAPPSPDPLASPGAAGDAYRSAGVDIDRAGALVEAIKPLARSTARAGVIGGIGGFGGLFDPRAAGFTDPVLVAATDGVGTKLKIAIATGRHDGVGIDLVAMSVNDLIVQGAEPLFFLDYFATGRLDTGVAEAVLAGIAEGCRQAGCALIGGETAEMPGFYAPGEYDLAGFAVGAAERGTLLPAAGIAAGDEVLGLASTGLHSNGFSLVRRLVGQAKLEYGADAPFAPGTPLGTALLAPTRIYVRSVLGAVRAGLVKALAHITGGGLTENIPRVLPDGLGAALDAGCWPLPPVFAWLGRVGGLSAAELARTFNCGIGMVAIVAPDQAGDAIDRLTAAGETVHRIGRVVPAATGLPLVRIDGTESAWPG